MSKTERDEQLAREFITLWDTDGVLVEEIEALAQLLAQVRLEEVEMCIRTLAQLLAQVRLEEVEMCIRTVKSLPYRAHGEDDVDFHSGCKQTTGNIVDALEARRAALRRAAGEK